MGGAKEELVSLTPSQEHYLKKELLNLELNDEFNKLSTTYKDNTGLRKFGPPFAPYDPTSSNANYKESMKMLELYRDQFNMEFPLLRHFFTNFIMTFPFILQYQQLGDKNSDENFWVNKVQTFYEIWKTKKISNSDDRGQLSKRKLALFKFVKLLLMLYNSSILVYGDEIYFEENEKANKNAYKKVNAVLPLADLEAGLEDVLNKDNYINGIDVNVCGVRRSKELKVIKSFNNNFQRFWKVKLDDEKKTTYYIARRYSEFKQLNQDLRNIFPVKELPKLPSKIKHNSNIDYQDDSRDSFEIDDVDDADNVDADNDDDDSSSLVTASTYKIENDFVNALRMSSSTSAPKPSSSSSQSLNSSPYPSISKNFLPTMKNNGSKIDDNDKKTQSSSKTSLNSTASSISNVQQNHLNVKLPREKLRVPLRGYLHQLLKIPEVKNSVVFKAFLEKNKFEKIESQVEKNDIELRLKLDDLIISQQLKFQQETIKSINILQENIKELKHDILNKDGSWGLSPLFKEIETKEKIEDLPAPLRSFVDLSKIEVASTLYEVFVANDQSAELLKIMKKLHAFFPYKIVATIMRFTNPMAIVKKLIDLFLIQSPSFNGNGKSLLQYIFTLILNDDVKQLTKETENLVEKIKSDGTKYGLLVDKIKLYINTNDDNLVLDIKKNSAQLGIDLTLSILLNNNDLPIKIENNLLEELIESYRNFKRVEKLNKDQKKVDSQQEYNKLSKDSSLYFNLNELFRAMLRRRDKDHLKELWDEPELTRLIKELIAIFFQPLIKVFTQADIYIYIPILKNFVSDLIKLVEDYRNNYSMLATNSASNNIVVKFISLLTNYENYLYKFIHNLYVNDIHADAKSQIFVKLIDWLNSFIVLLNYVKSDRPDLKIDLNALIKDLTLDGTVNREELIKEIDGIIDKINDRRQLYQEILESQNADADEGTRTSKINENWNKINKNLTSLFELDDGSPLTNATALPSSEIDELNMEFIDFEEKNEKHQIIDKFTDNKELLKYINENKSFTQEIDFEDDDSRYYKKENIKKLQKTFKLKLYDVLKDYKKQ
ncbi:hypothetical protein PACTADRAFT_48886 [Pachysolen tannophilus NRRL Y-2460]|uniref:PX domain-containing protein n=1 Tax=Pachysolen tannophilus NRRL Y-2460 TaxID=669874 RepID=A0A1E4TZC9_PACTA|nr:hypothetical protein PACTADRAFT_48886 [Pachysolen tannophilus NRRL Y-2460]